MQQEELERDEERQEGSAVMRETLSGALQNMKGALVDSEDEDVWSEPESGFDPDEWENEIDEEDEAVLAAFMSADASQHKQKTLADIIMEKLQSKQEEEQGDKRVRYVNCVLVVVNSLRPLCTVLPDISWWTTEVAGCNSGYHLPHYCFIHLLFEFCTLMEVGTWQFCALLNVLLCAWLITSFL